MGQQQRGSGEGGGVGIGRKEKEKRRRRRNGPWRFASERRLTLRGDDASNWQIVWEITDARYRIHCGQAFFQEMMDHGTPPCPSLKQYLRLYEISRERIFMWNVGCQLRAVELTGRLAISLFLFLFFFVFFLLATCWTGMEIRNGEAKWKMSGILCVKYRCLAFDGLERVIKFYVLFLSFVSWFHAARLFNIIWRIGETIR